MRTSRTLCLLAAFIIAGAAAFCDDWPQWRGPNRDGKSNELGLLKQWPEGGPPLLWSVEGVGRGYSSVAIVGGTAYATGLVGTQGYLFAFDRAGNLSWNTVYGPERTNGYAGPRSTPTVDGGQVFLISANGLLACLDATTGKLNWSLDTEKEFKADKVVHGICENVIVAGGNVICTPGGPGASLIAVDKITGKLAWQTTELSEKPGYNSTILVERGDKRLIVALTAGSLVGLDSATGQIVWRHIYDEKGGAWPCAVPVYADGIVYAPTGKDCAAQGFALGDDGGNVRLSWTQDVMKVHHGSVVVLEGCVYGTPNLCGPTCLDLRTGAIKWQAPKEIGLGSIAYADGMLYLCFADGLMRLAKATPDSYQEVSTFKLPKGSGDCWAHPSIADRRLYMRRGVVLMTYDIAASSAAKAAARGSRVFTSRWDGAEPLAVRLAAPDAVVAPRGEAPAIDGSLDDPCWKNAPPIQFMSNAELGEADESGTAFRVCQDADNLYIAYRRVAAMKDGKPVPFVAKQTGPDAKPWEDDEMEVFVSDAAGKAGLQFALACGGGFFDGRREVQSDKPADKAWDGHGLWQHAVKAAEGEWTAEIAIPKETIRKGGLDPAALAVNLMSQNLGGRGSRHLTLIEPGQGGFGRCSQFLPVVEKPTAVKPRPVTVRLHFAERNGRKPGERVFDLRLQDKPVVTGFDVVAAAGGPDIPIVREVKGVSMSADGTITLQAVMKPNQPVAPGPLVRAVEVLPE